MWPSSLGTLCRPSRSVTEATVHPPRLASVFPLESREALFDLDQLVQNDNVSLLGADDPYHQSVRGCGE